MSIIYCYLKKTCKLKSLYDCSVTALEHYVLDVLEADLDIETRRPVEIYLKSNLPANVRHDLYTRFRSSKFFKSSNGMDSVNALLVDPATKKLIIDPAVFFGENNIGLHFSTFEFIFKEKVFNLDTLIFGYCKHIFGIEGSDSTFASYLHKSLELGLGQHLNVLFLPGVANNNVMKILGRHCTQLSYLDISKSVGVDFVGYLNFIFKNFDRIDQLNVHKKRINLHRSARQNLGTDLYFLFKKSAKHNPFEDGVGEFIVDTTYPRSALQKIGSLDGELNPCCHTLQEIRIKDIEYFSDAIFFLLLIYLKKLKEIDNVVLNGTSIILSIHDIWPDLTLEMTQLFNATKPLTLQTVTSLSQILPELRALITDAIHVGYTDYWPLQKLNDLTLLGNFTIFHEDEPQYTLYASVPNGLFLKRLEYEHFPVPFNFLVIAENCPNLEELNAAVYIPKDTSGTEIEKRQLLHLKKASLLFKGNFRSLLAMCPKLQDLKIIFPSLNHDKLQDLSSQQLSCFDYLTNLSLFRHTRRVIPLEFDSVLLLFEIFRNLENLYCYLDKDCSEELELVLRNRNLSIEERLSKEITRFLYSHPRWSNYLNFH